MRLAMRLPSKKGDDGSLNDIDPRDSESAEVIDLASRSGFSPVVDRKSKTDGLGLAAGVAIVGGLGAVTFWAMNASQLPEQQSVGNPNAAAPVAAAPATTPAEQPKPAPSPTTPGAPRPDPAPAPVFANSPTAVAGPTVNPFSSPSLVFDRSFAPGTLTNPTGVRTGGGGGDGSGGSRGEGGGVGGTAGAFAAAIGGVGGGTAQARQMENPSTTVTKGTLIPAVLETAINTDVPGYVRAVVNQDVRSFDGKRVLIPRSSRLVGQYQSGVQQGQKRAYVIWTDLIRPDGATIRLQSPAVGFDGTTGLAGDVDTHFFSRFGSSILLSVVGGLGAIASGGTTLITGAGQSAASTALQQDGQRPPTIRVRMGEPIRVFTARDLDFSTVSN